MCHQRTQLRSFTPFFPITMYKCENWTEKKADRKKLIYSKYVTTFHNSMYGTGEHYSK